MEDIIKLEINKDNPDWSLVAKLAKQLADSTTQTDSLGFKIGHINFIKERQYSTFYDQISTLDRDRYQIIYCEYIRRLPAIFDKIDLNSKFVILISYKDMVSALTSMGKPLLRFTGSDKATIKGDKAFALKNLNTNERILFKKDELKSVMRDRILNSFI